MKKRCQWCTNDELYIAYHDKEWGVPVYDDKLLFEFLILEGMQAGLSWLTILKKRKAFRIAFSNFNAKKMAAYDANKIDELMKNEGIIRNRLKIQSAISNAQAYLKVKKEWGSFAKYIWYFNDLKLDKKPTYLRTTSPVSDALSKDLKKRGFNFVGTTICYAFMQAIGMVNDHEKECFRRLEIKAE
jgi:DNA-3-methyladenine glycosylase I